MQPRLGANALQGLMLAADTPDERLVLTDALLM